MLGLGIVKLCTSTVFLINLVVKVNSECYFLDLLRAMPIK